MKLTCLTAALSFSASPIMGADEMTGLLDWFINPDQQAD
jgi:putative hydroxymethylpyrimidine transport system substrate-binding protein